MDIRKIFPYSFRATDIKGLVITILLYINNDNLPLLYNYNMISAICGLWSAEIIAGISAVRTSTSLLTKM